MWFRKDYSAKAMRKRTLKNTIRILLFEVREKADIGISRLVLTYKLNPREMVVIIKMGYSIDIIEGSQVVSW